MNIAPSRLRNLLRYDPETGKLFWISEMRGGFKQSVVIHYAGEEAGGTRKDGRRVVRVDDRLHMAYRVAWTIHHGEWPEGEIDHINGDGTDDRLCNLRDVPRAMNQENLRVANKSKTSSKYLGVYRNKPNRSRPWKSAIQVNGKNMDLGSFNTEQEAYTAYVFAKRALHSGCTI